MRVFFSSFIEPVQFVDPPQGVGADVTDVRCSHVSFVITESGWFVIAPALIGGSTRGIVKVVHVRKFFNKLLL